MSLMTTPYSLPAAAAAAAVSELPLIEIPETGIKLYRSLTPIGDAKCPPPSVCYLALGSRQVLLEFLQEFYGVCQYHHQHRSEGLQLKPNVYANVGEWVDRVDEINVIDMHGRVASCRTDATQYQCVFMVTVSYNMPRRSRKLYDVHVHKLGGTSLNVLPCLDVSKEPGVRPCLQAALNHPQALERACVLEINSGCTAYLICGIPLTVFATAREFLAGGKLTTAILWFDEQPVPMLAHGQMCMLPLHVKISDHELNDENHVYAVLAVENAVGDKRALDGSDVVAAQSKKQCGDAVDPDTDPNEGSGDATEDDEDGVGDATEDDEDGAGDATEDDDDGAGDATGDRECTAVVAGPIQAAIAVDVDQSATTKFDVFECRTCTVQVVGKKDRELSVVDTEAYRLFVFIDTPEKVEKQLEAARIEQRDSDRENDYDDTLEGKLVDVTTEFTKGLGMDKYDMVQISEPCVLKLIDYLDEDLAGDECEVEFQPETQTVVLDPSVDGKICYIATFVHGNCKWLLDEEV